MASIPRDTSWFPRAARNGGGTSGAGRVNAMYYFYKRWSRFGPSAVDCRALDRFRADVAGALRTEIDHYAMVRMRPMVDLVDRIGPIRVDVPGPIVDTSYGRHGLFFPLATDYRLKGNPRCKPKPSRCRSTLAYVRSRSGREGSRYNSDFRRAYRQQDVVLQTARRVRERGTGAALTDLVSFYALPSTVMNHPAHKSLKAAYSFYNVSTKTPWVDLMGDALVMAKKVCRTIDNS